MWPPVITRLTPYAICGLRGDLVKCRNRIVIHDTEGPHLVQPITQTQTLREKITNVNVFVFSYIFSKLLLFVWVSYTGIWVPMYESAILVYGFLLFVWVSDTGIWLPTVCMSQRYWYMVSCCLYESAILVYGFLCMSQWYWYMGSHVGIKYSFYIVL